MSEKSFLKIEFAKKTKKIDSKHNALKIIFIQNVCYHNFF